MARIRSVILLGCFAAPIVLIAGCRDRSEELADTSAATVISSHRSEGFAPAEVSTEVAVGFRHVNGMQGEYWPAEILGAGVALLDSDLDGDLDLYFRQGGQIQPGVSAPEQPTDRLFLNQWAETGSLGFIDVSQEHGIGWYGYGMGVATGDFDNDGDPDLFLTNLDSDVLLENRGDVFLPVSGPWLQANPSWTTAAVFFDADRDGWLDLYVGGYIDFSLENQKDCARADSKPEYCGPLTYQPLADSLFRNQGGGQFVDVSLESGISELRGNSLGAVSEDLDGDQWPDLLVANDANENFLWINDQKGGFRNEALIRGVAVNAVGQRESSMGIALADPDRDGYFDFLLTHLATETNTLYRGDPEGFFADWTSRSRLAVASRGLTGFGVGWLDVNGDAWLDLLSVNGEVNTIAAQRDAGDELPLRQKPQLFLSEKGESFADISSSSGTFFSTPIVGRAAAFGDLDQDGDLDVVVTENNGPARVLLNQSPSNRRWLGLRLVTGDLPRDALGALVRMHLADGTVLVGRCQTDGSYLAANDPRVLLRIPTEAKPVGLQIDWPDGSTEQVEIPTEGTYHEIRQRASS